MGFIRLRRNINHSVQPLDAENRMSRGVEGIPSAISLSPTVRSRITETIAVTCKNKMLTFIKI